MRKEKIFVVTQEGRDLGKQFLIKEMPAMRAEAWAMRALQALAKSGVDVPENALNGGAAALFSLGVSALAHLPWEELSPLLAEMMECVTIIPDPSRPAFTRRLVGEDDVEEVLTLLLLRDAVLELHLGFSLAARLSASPGSVAAPS